MTRCENAPHVRQFLAFQQNPKFKRQRISLNLPRQDTVQSNVLSAANFYSIWPGKWLMQDKALWRHFLLVRRAPLVDEIHALRECRNLCLSALDALSASLQPHEKEEKWEEKKEKNKWVVHEKRKAHDQIRKCRRTQQNLNIHLRK